MLVVLDTNAFWGDVHATRKLLRSVLDDAQGQQKLEVFVPQVVLDELDRQFGERTRSAVKKLNKAIGEQELRRLGIEPPTEAEVDEPGIAGYRETLKKRLVDAGTTILPTPDDLSQALAWAIAKRKPFKTSGVGMPDAVLWLTVLALADEREDEIILVTTNTDDFGEKDDSDRLAEVLRDDLEQRGCPRDRVRLVVGIDAFAEELGERDQAALEKAVRLSTSSDARDAVVEALAFEHVGADVLELEIEVDEPAQITATDVGEIDVGSAAELPGGLLRVDADATVEVSLDFLIAREDLGTAERLAGIDIVDSEFNRTYADAVTTVTLVVPVAIDADDGGISAHARLDLAELAPSERVRRALRDDLLDLLETVAAELRGSHLEDYRPDAPLESDIEELEILHVYGGGHAHLLELMDNDGDGVLVHLGVEVDADIQWVVTAPSPFDAEHFAASALNEESNAPILQDVDSATPLEIDLTARWDRGSRWHDVEINTARLEVREAQRRRERPTAAEDLMADEFDRPNEAGEVPQDDSQT